MNEVHSTSRYAAERYILGEMSTEERDTFEEHFFSCQECADQVQAAAAFVDNARVVLPEMDRVRASKAEKSRFRWFDWQFAPQAALAGLVLLGGFVGYQNTVEIPRLRASANAVDGLTITGAQQFTARRAASNYSFSSKAPVAPVVIPHEWEAEYPKYSAEILRDSGSSVFSTAEVPAVGPVLVSIPASRLGAGKYIMMLYGISAGGAKEPVGRYPFEIVE